MKAFLEAGSEYLFAEVTRHYTSDPTDNLDDERSLYGNAELSSKFVQFMTVSFQGQ
eukprot:m.1748 g.1748  ORF g.1748 m.1748 type:complete len:56 (-) comp2543_c0_seq1:149-316(-)